MSFDSLRFALVFVITRGNRSANPDGIGAGDPRNDPVMEKTFDPKAVEGRIAATWREASAFQAGHPRQAEAEPFTIVIPPPNVTGSLHMGHALNTTLQDILCRFERMRGKDVLWQPGTDHAGIATQMVVERQLVEAREPGRLALGRDKFVSRVWEWKTQSGGAIIDQLKRLGASCDWSRERFTLDEGLSCAVIKVFVELYKQGLIYKDKRLVNWDPQLQTAISDLEVEQVETDGHLWHFKYPVMADDGLETGEFVVVATTRPETMLGDSAVAVHPDDARYKHLHGKKVRLPLVGRLIPIIADEYSNPEEGTGAVKITPAHDFNDFEVGRRHENKGVRLINVLDAEARIDLQSNDEFKKNLPAIEDLDDLGKGARAAIIGLHGQDRFVVRRTIVELLDRYGFLERVEQHVHMVPHGDRSGAVIEPWLTDQWYIDARTLAQPATEAVRNGKTRFVPQNWEKTYLQWLDTIQPWCISRQLWWGHQIPAWYGPEMGAEGKPRFGLTGAKPSLTDQTNRCFVAQSEADAVAEAQKVYGKPVIVVNDALAAVEYIGYGQSKSIPIWRDPDVLDTWFSSALWPFSTLGWPDQTLELKNRYPTNVLITAFDIIFFWVARMMMMGLHFLHDVPFRDVYIHALVRDERGAKMSKTKGNVVDPLSLVEAYGADALRFTLAAMAAQGRDIKLSTQRIEGYRNFGTKLWNAARFAELNGCMMTASFDPLRAALTLNRWIIGQVARAIAEITAAIETYRFNDAANAAFRFVWSIFCDWYLEFAKPLLQGRDGPEKEETRATTAFVREQIIKLLHPFMPFITEELWAITASHGALHQGLLTLAEWPRLEGCENPRAEAEIDFVIELISEIRSVRAEMNVPAATQIPLVLVSAPPDVKSRIRAWAETIKRLARLSEISFSRMASQRSVRLIVRNVVAALALEEIIDVEAEKARLSKEIAKLQADMERIEAKLVNANFVARAPKELVEENRERLATVVSRIEKLAAALATFGRR
jgi:valyl-tRNA synthetase